MSTKSNSNAISGMMSVAQNTDTFANKMESIESNYNRIDNNMQSFDVLMSNIMPSIKQNSQAIIDVE